MSKKVISVRQDTSVEKIAQLMMTYAIKRLPVMDGSKIIGIVSPADISAQSPWASTSRYTHPFTTYRRSNCINLDPFKQRRA